METTGGQIACPTFAEIVEANRTIIERYGGRFSGTNNLKEEGALKWVLDAIQHPFSDGTHLYPTLVKKATALTWKIIAGHVFWDGNKRTGMSVGLTLLKWNGAVITATDEEIEEVAL